ncbi:MAG: T9SS type A sorting domain-containing protein [Bacteroidales bacterium]|nr:T9SS type A sorting domain-containing protein [Bacteroidales bacterium]
MKKHLLLFAMGLLMSASVVAQGFVSTDKQWNVLLTAFPNYVSTEIFKIQGDSVVDGTTYSKIWVSMDSLVSWQFMGLLREADNIVYYMQPNFTEGVLYNFKLQVGETAMVRNFFCYEYDIPVTVIALDTVEYFGVERRQWLLQSEEFYDTWVEGIGSLSGPLYTMYNMCVVCPVWELLCYHENDILLYQKPFATTCYGTSVGIEEPTAGNPVIISPNPVKRGDNLTIKTSGISGTINIFNSSGMLVRSFLQSDAPAVTITTDGMATGIYFVTTTTPPNKRSAIKLVLE